MHYIILRRSGPFSQNMLQNSLFNLLFSPCWTIAMRSWQVFKPLQLIQNAAARFIFNEPKRTHITPLFINLHWLPTAACIKIQCINICQQNHLWLFTLLPKFLIFQTYVPLEACVLQVNVTLLYHPKEAQNYFLWLFHLLFPSGGMTCPTQSEQLNPYPSSRNG